MGSALGVIGNIIAGRILDKEFRVLTLDGLREVYEEAWQELSTKKIGILLLKIGTLGDATLLPFLLKSVVRNLKASIRVPTDFVGRADDTTFVILLTDINKRDLKNVAARLVAPLSLTVSVGERSVTCITSISCAHGSELKENEVTFGDLYKMALMRMKKGQSDRGSGIHCG